MECCKREGEKIPAAFVNKINQNKVTIVDIMGLGLVGLLEVKRDGIEISADPVTLHAILIQSAQIKNTCGGIRCVLTVEYKGRGRFEDVADRVDEIKPGVYRLLFLSSHVFPHEKGTEDEWLLAAKMKGEMIHILSERGIDIDFTPKVQVQHMGADNEAPKRSAEDISKALDGMSLRELVNSKEVTKDHLDAFLESPVVLGKDDRGTWKTNINKLVTEYNKTVPKENAASISSTKKAMAVFITEILLKYNPGKEGEYAAEIRKISKGATEAKEAEPKKQRIVTEKNEPVFTYEDAIKAATKAQLKEYLTQNLKVETFMKAKIQLSELIGLMSIEIGSNEKMQQAFIDFMNTPKQKKDEAKDVDEDEDEDEPAPAPVPVEITPDLDPDLTPEPEPDIELAPAFAPAPVLEPARPTTPAMSFGFSLGPLSQPAGAGAEWEQINTTSETLSVPIIISSSADGQLGVDSTNGVIDIWRRDNAYVYLNKAELWQMQDETLYRLSLVFTPRDSYSSGILMKSPRVAGNSVNITFSDASLVEQTQKFVRDANAGLTVLPVLTLVDDYSLIVVPGRNMYAITRN